MKLLRRIPVVPLALGLVLVAALLLRVQGWQRFGVPDEDTLKRMTWGLFINPLPAGMHVLPGYPPLFPYLNFYLANLYILLLRLVGGLTSGLSFIVTPLGALFTLKAGRLVVALTGMLQVLFVYRIGRREFNPATALTAALLLAVNPFLVFNSHIFKSDVPLAFLLTVCLYFLMAFVRDPERMRHLFFFALFFGLAVAAKFNGAVEVVLLVPAAWMVRRTLTPKRVLQLGGILLGGGALGFFLAAPNWLVYPLINLKRAYAYVKEMYSAFTFYDRGAISYFRYLGDFLTSFGPLLLAFFLLGLTMAFLKKNRPAMILSFYFLIYFFLQGKSNFYGNRMALPLYSAMALLIAKALWVDLPLILGRMKWAKILGSVAAGILVALLCAQHSLANLRTFNLLRTTTQMDAAIAYRISHLPEGFSWARENFTPMFPGDVGLWDLTQINAVRFYGPAPFQFLSSGILGEHLLHWTRNQELHNALVERLRPYRAFHRIRKARFSPWDGDIVFWYRPRSELARRIASPLPVSLPRLFYFPRESNSSLYYPLQPYEKDPGFGKLEKGCFSCWLYSSKKIERLTFRFASPLGPIHLQVKVNGRSAHWQGEAGNCVWSRSLDGLRPVPLQADFLYRLEILALSPEKSCYFCFTPGYAGPSQPPIDLALVRRRILVSGRAEEVPPLYSPQVVPDWMRRFYRLSGLDLSLLAQVNRECLLDNSTQSLLPQETDWLALPRGVYRLVLEGMPAADQGRLPSELALDLEWLDAKGRREEVAAMWPSQEGDSFTARLRVADEVAFFRVRGGALRDRNLLLRRLWVSPDYRRILLGEDPRN